MVTKIELGEIVAGCGQEGHQECSSECLSADRQGANLRATSHGHRYHPRVCDFRNSVGSNSSSKKLRTQERETPREYLDRESHYVWGKRYLLKVVEKDSGAGCGTEAQHPSSSGPFWIKCQKKQDVLDRWYREQLKEAIPHLIAKWEPLIGVKVERFFVQRMKTKWGSCNSGSKSIRLNSELAKKPPECLEYIVVHEMVHLLEPTHNRTFIALMDQFMPKWQFYRDNLNRLPVRHESWGY